MMINRPTYEVSGAVFGPFATLLAFMMFAVVAFSAQANPTCESLTGKAQFAMNLNEIQRLVKGREFPAAEQKIVDLETAWILAEPEFRQANEQSWKRTDEAMSNAVSALQRAKPDVDGALKAIHSLQNSLAGYCEK